MNRIVVEQKEYTIKNIDVIIEKFSNKIQDIHIYGKVNIGIISIPDDLVLNIYLHEQAILNMDLFVHLKNSTNKLIIYSEIDTKLNLHYACTFEGNNNLSIYNHIKNNKTETNILVRAIENGGTIEIKAEGVIYKNTFDSIYSEDIKALTNHFKSVTIKPNLLVNTNSVIANHNATISNINEKNLFYLKSKGISDSSAVNLLKSGFLKGILKLDLIKQEVKLFE